MVWLGIQLESIDLGAWWAEAREVILQRLLESGAVIAAALIAYPLARWILHRIEARLTRRTASEIDDLIVATARRALSLSIVFWALWRLAHVWNLPKAASVVAAGWLIALAFPLGGLLADLLKTAEEHFAPKTETTLDDTALPLLNKAVRFAVLALAVLLALDQLEINITPLVAGAGVAGIAISLAAQDTLSNLVAGILLILDRPFEVGDRIELWQAPMETATWGDVIEVGLRATKIRNPDNLIFVIPNSELMRRDIVNYTASGDDIRVRIPIDIAYDADSELAKKLVQEVALETRGVQKQPPPQVIIRRFGESGVGLELRVWIAEARRRRAVADEITDRVKRQFDEHGIEIPYPKRDLYIRTAPDSTRPEPQVTAELGRSTGPGEKEEAAGGAGSTPPRGAPEPGGSDE